MKNQIKKLLFLSLTLCLSSCLLDLKESDLQFSGPKGSIIEEIEVDPNQETDAKFLAIKKNLIDVSCLKCHNANQTKHSNLTLRAVVLEHADDMLYRMTDAWDLDTDKMPPRGERVDLEVIKEFKVWKSDTQFSNLQKKLFEVSCLKCHGPNQTRRTDLSSKEVIINNYDEVVYRMTKAFDDDEGPMPPIGKGAKVSTELIQELQKWKESL